MEIDGKVVSDEVFAHGVSAAYEAGRRLNARREAAGEELRSITPFDLLSVAGLTMFAEACVDVAVLEVGMGGRWMLRVRPIPWPSPLRALDSTIRRSLAIPSRPLQGEGCGY